MKAMQRAAGWGVIAEAGHDGLAGAARRGELVSRA
jgi:hypothetical protein